LTDSKKDFLMDKDRIIRILEWMIYSLKVYYTNAFGDEDLPDDQINWSPEMKEAMDVLEELKRE